MKLHWTEVSTSFKPAVLQAGAVAGFWVNRLRLRLRHLRCGRGNHAVLENFTELSKRFNALQPRTPIAPGVNDGRGNIEAVSEFL